MTKSSSNGGGGKAGKASPSAALRRPGGTRKQADRQAAVGEANAASGSNSDGTSSGGNGGSSHGGSEGAVVKFRMPAVVSYGDGRRAGSQASNLSGLTSAAAGKVRTGGQRGGHRFGEWGDGKSGSSSLSQSSDGTAGGGPPRPPSEAGGAVQTDDRTGSVGRAASGSSSANSSSDGAKPGKAVTGSSEGAGTSGSNSRTSGSGSGSGSDNNGTSTSGGPANVTASAGDGRATTSSGDDRSSSNGGGKSSGSGSDTRDQPRGQGGSAREYYQGQVDFPLQQGGDLQPRQGSGHVAVAADDAAAAMLSRHPPHASRHHHRGGHHPAPPGARADAKAAPPRPPVPPAAGPLPPPPPPQPNQQQGGGAGRVIGLRLPPSDEQAVLQRVPRTHATVVAHDLPPPPTSSDAWSSSGSSGRGRKRSASGGGAPVSSGQAAAMAQPPMVASVRLARGGAVDSVAVDDGSRSSTDGLDSDRQGAGGRGSAVHVTMDDPILKKRITLKQGGEQAEASAKGVKAAGAQKKKAKLAKAEKAKHRPAGSETDDAQAETGSGSAGSGSDEGYEGGSSERQSGGSGSDSISSSDGKKKTTAAAAPSRAEKLGEPPKKVTTTVDSKRTETSSMSSSVLADFSSIMNEDGSIVLSRADSPGSSLSSNGAKNKAADDDRDGGDDAEMLDAIGQNLASTSGNKHKRTESSSSAAAKSRKRSKDYFDGDAKAPGAMTGGLAIMERALAQKVRSGHHHHYHSRSTGRKMLEENFLSAKAAQREAELSDGDSQRSGGGGPARAGGYGRSSSSLLLAGVTAAPGVGPRKGGDGRGGAAPDVYALGQDVMAIVCGFLDPVEVHAFLTQPLSKSWLVTYTAPQELWKILCTGRPFYAKLDEGESGSENSSTRSFPICNDLEMRHLFGRYRLLYTSFVRCMKYLNRLQDDALNGRTPSVPADSDRGDIYPYSKNSSLKAYFAKARRLVRGSRRSPGSQSSSDAALSLTTDSIGSSAEEQKREESAAQLAAVNPSGVKARAGAGGGRRLGRSMITDRLLRPTLAGDVADVNLPWSCAIYSVVNWMVAFADVEGIQIMCLKCLPYLLEDESQRTTAQRAGLTDSVLRAMVLFPDSIELHTVAFHTLVLLARPLGGNEGMLFHTAMVNTRGIFNNGSNCSKNGIVIMLDSMRRFAQDEILQAMSCWSLVNVALTPLQKSMLVKLGGLTVTANAMLQHPYNAEVQFRALFALINLVIPSETRPESEEMREFEREIFQQLGEVGEISEKEMLDASVGQISNLVVVAMKNFCSSEAILNRACLVLHNLSLNEEYHSILLWTPNCYQMLEWCLGNYPHDHVLQQSAGGTIQRLNSTLSGDEDLRARLAHSIRAQQQHSLEQARQEAVSLQEQERDSQAMDLS